MLKHASLPELSASCLDVEANTIGYNIVIKACAEAVENSELLHELEVSRSCSTTWMDDAGKPPDVRLCQE